jgi:hypothetical protein
MNNKENIEKNRIMHTKYVEYVAEFSCNNLIDRLLILKNAKG